MLMYRQYAFSGKTALLLLTLISYLYHYKYTNQELISEAFTQCRQLISL